MDVINIKSDKKSKKNVILLVVAVLFLIIALGGIYFGWKIHAVSKRINISNSTGVSFTDNVQAVASLVVPSSRQVLKGEEEGRINVLLLGTAGENQPGKNLTDTIMIMSINTASKKVALLSLPRDLYVSALGKSCATRINEVYHCGLLHGEGVDPIKSVVEEITGIPIHYFLALDFEGFKKIIDDIGGINIMVERDIYDPRYPGPNYSYETFEIKKGLHHIDGATALKYARERHADPEGDFGRARRQQQIIQAFKNKVFSLQTFLNVFKLNSLLNTLEKNIKTNVSLEKIESFIHLSKQVDSQNVTNIVVDAWKKDSLLKVSHLQRGDLRVFILIPRVGNFSEIQELAQNIFDVEKIRERWAEIEKEKASIAIINQSSDKNLAVKIQNLLREKLKLTDVKLITSRSTISRDNTIIIDNTSGKKLFSLDELIKKLPATLGKERNDIISVSTDSDFVILLGKDLEKTYAFEEDSIEEFNKASEDQEYFLNNQQTKY
ncbi:MAG: LCP family protein [Candidatus Moranbacteria bacterium]|nr:LCP family protein [Candidatus Moranbacteria bacterium]